MEKFDIINFDMTRKKIKKVYVALSGGRDSAVAALLLQRKEYEVTGIFFKPHKYSQAKEALQIAKRLGISFQVWDFRKEFKKKIINNFLFEYKNGNTPNPCIRCNRLIKFGLFYKKAKKLGADYIATGHYAKIQKKNNDYVLTKARDIKKDQSYFLWGIDKKYLKNIIFPLGDLSFEKVKKIATKNHFSKKEYKSSQEVCFVPGTNMQYLKDNLKNKKGKIIDIKTKKELGEHNGHYFYTLGQRGGLGLGGGPWYVVKKNPNKNILYVSRNHKDCVTKKIALKNINLLKKIQFPFKAKVKPRYGHPGSNATIKGTKNKIILVFTRPQRFLTPGQSCVFYQKNILIGGGIIEKL